MLTFKERLLMREVVRRASSHVNVLQDALDKQVSFIKNPSRFKGILATRRAAKSYTAGLAFMEASYKYPGASMLYVALTGLTAKRILIKDVLKPIAKKCGIELDINDTTGTVRFPTGAHLYLIGADAKPDEIEKALGQKYAIVIIDEGASYHQDLRSMVYEHLKPAVADYSGEVWLIGTPGSNTKSFFYDVTTGREPGWYVERWRALDNPYVAKQIQEDIDTFTRENPRFLETPAYKRMYLGEWVIDDDLLVSKFLRERNLIAELPISKHRWTYHLGVDLGHSPDPSSFVVVCHREFDKKLYVLRSEEYLELDVTSVADKIKALDKVYDFSMMVVDGANKQAVEEMRNRHGLPLISADKTGKADFIEMMNSDFIQGNMVLVDSTTATLQAEMETLVWDEKLKRETGKREEHPACPNHNHDALLYIWRHSYNYAAREEVKKPKKGTPEAINLEEEEMWQRIADARQAKESEDDFPDYEPMDVSYDTVEEF